MISSLLKSEIAKDSIRYIGRKLVAHRFNCGACKYGMTCKKVDELRLKLKQAKEKFSGARS